MPDVTGVLDRAPWWAASAAGGVLAALLLVLLVAGLTRLIRGRRPAEKSATDEKPSTAARLVTVLTVVAALIATATSAQGMWNFFGKAFHVDGPIRVALFALFEIALVVFALNARLSARNTDQAGGGCGFDDFGVWLMAALTAVLAASEADNAQGMLGRLLVPFVAVLLWERDLLRKKAEARAKRRKSGEGSTIKDRRVFLRFTPRRVAVLLGLADTEDRDWEEQRRDRKLARLARAAWRAYRLEEIKAAQWRRELATRRLDRRLLAAAGHLDLADDTPAVTKLRNHLAWLYQLRTSITAAEMPARRQAEQRADTLAAELEAVRVQLADAQAEAIERDRLELLAAEYAAQQPATSAEPQEQPEPVELPAAPLFRAAEPESVPEDRPARVAELAVALTAGKRLSNGDVRERYGVSESTARRLIRDAEEQVGWSELTAVPSQQAGERVNGAASVVPNTYSS